MTATIGVLTCLRLEDERGGPVAIELRGDSKTALHWASKLRFNSKAVNKAAILFTLLLVRQNVVITGTEHVPAEFNGQCDALSRRDKNGNFRLVSEFLPGTRDFRVCEDWRVREALRICDPRSTMSFHEFWAAAGQLVERARGEGTARPKSPPTSGYTNE